MIVMISKTFTDALGNIRRVGEMVDESVADINLMLNWIGTGDAEELDDTDEPRGNIHLQRTSVDFSHFLNNTALAEDWGYVWGGRGEFYDEYEREYLYNRYRTSKYNRDYYFGTQWRRWRNHHVCDCSGLLEAYSGINLTAHDFYNKSVEKGSMSSFPRQQGYLLFRKSSSNNRMVHVGVYDLDDRVIESKDSAYGVVETALRSGRWTHWGKPHFINFVVNTDTDRDKPFTLGRYLRYTTPLMKGQDVKNVQSALTNMGYPLVKYGIDGSYGKECYAMVRKFQKANGLETDGIVGPSTTRALCGTWTG